jgi:hypothetical protein
MAEDPTTPQPPSQSVSTPRTEPLAIWSLVLAILSWLGCLFLTVIPAIICGHLARSKIRKSNGAVQGMNFAVAALIIAYLQIPFGILGGIMLVDMIRSDRVRVQQLAVEKKEIASDDGKLKITTSGYWVKRSDLNKKASLQAGYQDKDMYLIVIGDLKSEVGNITLQQHHQGTREQMLHKLKSSSATEPVTVTIDGRPGLQDELSGINQGKNVTFLHTTLDERDSFQQILAWTVKSRWEKQNEELREVTNSFHAEK